MTVNHKLKDTPLTEKYENGVKIKTEYIINGNNELYKRNKCFYPPYDEYIDPRLIGDETHYTRSMSNIIDKPRVTNRLIKYGCDKETICKELNISTKTYYKHLKILGKEYKEYKKIKNNKELEKKVLELYGLKKDKEIFKELAISKSSFYRIIKDNKKNNILQI